MVDIVRFMRLNALLIVIVMIEAAYFLLSMVDGATLIRTLLAFPAAYVLPGFVLRLLASKSNVEDAPSLIVESFMISTIINVVTLSLLILLDAQHYYSLLPVSQLLLVVSAIFLMKVRNYFPILSINRVDGLVILSCLVVYLAAVMLHSLTPHLPTPDETSYIVEARYALLNGKVYGINGVSATSAFTYLIKGRFFWNLLIASFLASTGLKACFSHLLGSIFLFMIPLASLPLLPETLRKQGLLRLSLAIVLITNPLLFYFSGFALNDLAVAFYTTFAVALFVNSFRQNPFGGSIDFSKLVLCFSVFFLAMVFIKTNMAIFFSMYVVLLFFVLRRETRKVHRRLGYVLLILPIVYELLVDLPYNLSNWFFKNEGFARLFSGFLWVSPIEYATGFFVPRPWKSTTIFSHGASDYLQLVYTMISPEVLGIIFASMALVAPLALALKWVRRDQKMMILSLLLAITLPIQYFLMISNYSYRDAPRWDLFLFPIIVAFSLAILKRETDEQDVPPLFLFCIPAVLFLWIFAFLILNVGEIYFYYSYGIPQYLNWTINIVVPQLIIYILVLSVMSTKRLASISIKVPFTKLKRIKHLSLSKILYSTLIIAIILQNVHFSIFCFNNSSFFGQGHGLEDTDEFLASSNDSSVTFSNTYSYMRTHVADNVLAEGHLFPPPSTENQFLKLLDFAPNGSLIFISTDPEVTWLDARAHKNDYMKKYVDHDLIVSNTSKAYAIRIKNEQLSTGQISVFRLMNSLTFNGGMSQIVVNDASVVSLSKQGNFLELNVSSSAPSYVKTMLGTIGNVELFNITLLSGNNIVRLEGSSYLQHPTNFRVFMNGTTVYAGEVEIFNVEDIQLCFTLISISILLVILFLTRRSKPRRVRAYLVREPVAERIRTKRARASDVNRRTDPKKNLSNC